MDSEGVVYENWEQRAHDTETNLETIFPDIAASHIEHENKSCNDIQAGEPNEEFFNFAEMDDPLLACSPNSDEKNFLGDSKNSSSLKINIRSDSNSDRFHANFLSDGGPSYGLRSGPQNGQTNQLCCQDPEKLELASLTLKKLGSMDSNTENDCCLKHDMKLCPCPKYEQTDSSCIIDSSLTVSVFLTSLK